MLYVVITYLYCSVILYLLLGGADFGAGIIELFISRKQRDELQTITYRTIGPIWEANHMWLIIIIVILFVGFPPIYTILSTYLHIPLLLMLLGIIGRGTAFIFRHYDAVKDDMQRIYNFIFLYSSFITPFFLGVIAGAMIAGDINTSATSFYEAYLYPWTNIFSLSVGLFTVAICGFLAAVYLSGEDVAPSIRKAFIKQAKVFNIATVLTGGLTFITSEVEDISLIRDLFTDPVTLTVLILATLSLIFLWKFLNAQHTVWARLTAGFQVTLILFALGYHYFPDFVIIKNEPNLSVFNSAALGGPINTLAWALLAGSILILPALYYLIYSFQREGQSK